MNTKLEDPHPPQTIEEVDDSLYGAIKSEVKHEAAHIVDNKEPVDPSQSDVLVQKHFSGLFILILVLVVLFLGAAAAGIFIYAHH